MLERGKVMRAGDKYYNILEAAGIDTSPYLALSTAGGKLTAIDSNGKPIRNNILNQMLQGLPVSEETKVAFFGENSHFYGKIMNDGNIFNPYIHRRFLPARYLKFHKQGVHPQLMFTNKEILRILETEVLKISSLKDKDTLAYQQRAACFPLFMIKYALTEYVDSIEIREHEYGFKIVIFGEKRVAASRYDVSVYLRDKETLKNLIDNIESYKDCLPVIAKIRSYDVLNIPYFISYHDAEIDAFCDMYFLSGVYYTIVSLLSYGNYANNDFVKAHGGVRGALTWLKEELLRIQNDEYGRVNTYIQWNEYLDQILEANK